MTYSIRARVWNSFTVDRIDIIRSNEAYAVGHLCLIWNGFASPIDHLNWKSHRLIQKSQVDRCIPLIREATGTWCVHRSKDAWETWTCQVDICTRHRLYYYISIVSSWNRFVAWLNLIHLLLWECQMFWDNLLSIIKMHLAKLSTIHFASLKLSKLSLLFFFCHYRNIRALSLKLTSFFVVYL